MKENEIEKKTTIIPIASWKNNNSFLSYVCSSVKYTPKCKIFPVVSYETNVRGDFTVYT